MSVPSERRSGPWPKLLEGWSRVDPWLFRVGILLGLGMVGTFVFPGPLWRAFLSTILPMVAWLAMRACGERSGYGSERRFWQWTLWAQSFHVVGQALSGLVGDGRAVAWAVGPVSLVGLLWVAQYFFLILAAEQRPDYRRSASAARLDMRWVQPAAALFVFSLWIYFPIVGHGSTPTDTLQLHGRLGAVLAFWVAARFAWFGYEAVSLRWRLQYVVMAAAVAAAGAADWSRAFDPSASTVGSISWISAVGAVLWVVATTFNRRAFDGTKSRRRRAGMNLDLAGAHRSTTLLWALVPIFLQVFLHRIGALPAADKDLRELVALGSLALLGAYAVVQRYRVETETVEQWHRHQAMAEQLRSSEDDLRVLVERNRGVRELMESERKFALAFRTCPVGMCISTLDDAEVIDANDELCRLYGLDPAAVVGRRTDDLGLWANVDLGREIVDLVLTRGGVRNRSWSQRSADGEARRFEGSFELIHSGDRALMLTMVRDVTDRTLDPEADLEVLSPSGVAVFLVDHEQKVRFWNRASEALFGWTPDEAEGRSLSSLGLQELLRPASVSRGKSLVRRRVSTRDGLPLRLICRVTGWGDDDRGPTGRLVFAAMSRGGSRLSSTPEPYR